MKRHLPCLVMLLTAGSMTAGSIVAGHLSAQLSDTLQTLQPDKKVSVWIKLTETESLEVLKTSVDPSADLSQRYRSISERLRRKHANPVTHGEWYPT